MSVRPIFARASLLAVALSAVTAVPALAVTGHAAAPSQQHGATHAVGAVFVQNDDPAGNHVMAYARQADGTLTARGSYATGGVGGVLTGSVVDHLASQGAVQLDRSHHLLYVVNAGSNTVSVFHQDGTRLRLVQVVASGGDFPVSIAVSHDVVYVLNARSGGSIQGFRLVDGRLVARAGWHAELALPAGDPEFTHTPGQVTITPDGGHVVVTTKASTSSVLVWRLGQRGALVGEPTVTALPGTVPFAAAYDRAGRLDLAEAGTSSVATFRVGGNGVLTALSTAATGQTATCWIVDVRGAAYASNAGSASVSGFRLGSGGSLTPLGNTATDAGTVDAAATTDGRYLYVQAGASGIVDGFRVGSDGSLSLVGTVTVPNGAGAEGIAAL